MVLTFSLSVSFVILFVVTAVILIRKYLRQIRQSHKVWRRGEDTTTEMLTPIVSEAFSRDNRVLYSGRQHAFRISFFAHRFPTAYILFLCFQVHDIVDFYSI